MISKKNKIFITLFLCFLLLFSNFFCLINVANAQVKEDSGVLEDLRRDSNFNILNYPENLKDYSLNVIHLAEGESGAVYLYVYQPSGVKTMLTAKSISLCTKDYQKYYTADNVVNNNTPLFIVYSLELLDYEGTLFKYKVKDYDYTKDVNFQTDGEFDKTLTRNYEISTIYRDFIKGVDTVLDSEAIHTIKGLEVGKCFFIKTLNYGTNAISSEMVDVVSVTDKYVGSIRYDEGYYIIFEEDVDSWFVSFSTNKKMETLLEVDIYYNCKDVQKTRPYRFTRIGRLWDMLSSNYIELVSEQAVIQTITCEDEGVVGGGWFIDEHGFKRIVSVNDFLSGDGSVLPLEKKKIINNHQWVLRFVETIVSESNLDSSYVKSVISNVSLLRFKFETDGVVYNLGVVDDQSTPDEKPDAKVDGTCAGFTWKQILSMVALILLLILLAPILPFIFSILLTLLSLPFKLIGVIINKIKNGGDSNGKKT